MKCPNCYAVVPKTWRECRCGYNFRSGMAPDRPKIEQPQFDKHLSKPVYEKTEKLKTDELLKHLEQAEANEQQEMDNGPSRKLTFHGSGSTLFGIHLLNIFLTIVTLGIYYCWGKIKIRKYMYSQSEFEEDRFEFHGTGKELFFGWLKAALIIGVLVVGGELAKNIWPGLVSEIATVVVIYMAILLLTPVALVLTLRYRLSRTSWRGIRFSFRGNIKRFMTIYIPGLIFTTLTLGIYYHFLHHKSREYLVNNAYFGDTRFEYNGNARDLFGKYVKAYFLSILTMGIYWFWFSAERHRYYWTHTSFTTAGFNCTIQGFELFKLELVNAILFIFTLGLAIPFIEIRNTKFLFERLSLEGDLNLENIVQDAQSPTATGEGVADILDIDLVGMNLGI